MDLVNIFFCFKHRIFSAAIVNCIKAYVAFIGCNWCFSRICLRWKSLSIQKLINVTIIQVQWEEIFFASVIDCTPAFWHEMLPSIWPYFAESLNWKKFNIIWYHFLCKTWGPLLVKNMEPLRFEKRWSHTILEKTFLVVSAVPLLQPCQLSSKHTQLHRMHLAVICRDAFLPRKFLLRSYH